MTYKEIADRLVKVIDIASEVINTEYFPEELVDPMLTYGFNCKRHAQEVDPQIKALASIKSLENDFLTYWNEAKGEHIEIFWQMIYQNGLDVERKDVIRKVLKRGRIQSNREFNDIKDLLVAAEQIGRINREQALKLGELLEEFEA